MPLVRALLLCFAALLAGWAGPAWAERRVALVIGNGAYTKVGKLPNPPNDSRAVEAMFKAAGFDTVVRADNLNAAQMRRALRDFSDQVWGADIAIVFFAGHGIELNGANYLLPVDAVLERDIDVADEAIALDRIHQLLEPAKRLRLVILDACRDNPFVRSMRRTLAANRSIGRGLAAVEIVSTDTLIAYAAKAGSTAADGDGTNSPYTTAMLKHLTTPGLDVRLALGRVRDEVLRNTGRRQEPFVYGSLGGAEVALVAARAAPAPAPAAGNPAASAAAEAWDRVKDTNETAVLDAYLARFGDTFYGDLAKRRLAALRQDQQRVAAPQKQDEERKRAEAKAAADKQAADAKSAADRAAAEAKSVADRAAAEAKRAADKLAAEAKAAADIQAADAKAAADKASAESKKAADAKVAAEKQRTKDDKKMLDPVAALVPGSGQSARDCPECPEMVVVPAGSFMMGSPAGEAGREPKESPQRLVTIAQPFAVGKFEVTFAEWDAYAATIPLRRALGVVGKTPDDNGWGRGRRPVMNISWNDAKDYVLWLSKRTGKEYRLLSESEWEYVARAGTTTRFSTGPTITTDQANFNGKHTAGVSAKSTYREKTVEVGSFKANAFGLHDVHGNIQEWVEDCWHVNYQDAPADGTAWTTTCKDQKRILRGGNWYFEPAEIRSAFRNADVARYRGNFGLRVARSLTR
jgi:formylglycine-generating enzyme required for sulfatase activity